MCGQLTGFWVTDEEQVKILSDNQALELAKEQLVKYTCNNKVLLPADDKQVKCIFDN